MAKHEFVHDLENRKGYKSFKNYLFNISKTFVDYCETELLNKYGIQASGKDAVAILTDKVYDAWTASEELSENEKAAFDKEAAEREIVCNYVADRLLGGLREGGDYEQESYDALIELADTHRNIFQRFVDWVKGIINMIRGEPTFNDMADELQYLNERLAKVYDSRIKFTSENVKHKISYDKTGAKYWSIDTHKDIFKGLKTQKEIEKAAFNYILGMRDGKSVVDAIDGKKFSFIRLSAEEFTNSEDSKELKKNDAITFAQKMRLIPSIDDLAANANINWRSPDFKNHKLFKKDGFENFRGRVGIDNVIFNFVIRVGKAQFGDVFYDINLEVDQYLPHTKNDASDIKGSTSNVSIHNPMPKVNKNSSVNESHSVFTPFSEEFKAEKRKKYAERLANKYGGFVQVSELEVYLKDIAEATENKDYTTAYDKSREAARYIAQNSSYVLEKAVYKKLSEADGYEAIIN